ncbi:DUF1646 family protein [Ornithinibacillus halophilus]|uniref:Predicted cation transporter n=1 Tax=Ornithinibacillus halophilus TaxID=930117 RepID=A0A1M5IZN8_9BACI|nr:DUF1646 family protein [Ornithinibacillus halophilus]SHG33774.1 Predicted cation transporter [Ornithinibacillus halophilus]
MTLGLILILLIVLFSPFIAKPVEQNLEFFLFVMGIIAAIISGVLTKELWIKALENPINITLVVLLASLLFKWLKGHVERFITKLTQVLEMHIFLTLMIVILGLLSSIITAIVAAIILVSIISILPIDKKTEIRIVILACFSIGFGSVLTPVGEPLATITTSKLNQDFSFLFQLVGMEVIVGVLVIGIFALFFIRPTQLNKEAIHDKPESYKSILIRSIKIYVFVMGLTFLGSSYETLVNRYLLDLQVGYIYWMNMVSAVLDNATLASAEISPAMESDTIRFILLSLVVSGGMLIPGNIPNIIAANKLDITSKEWAKYGLPLGLTMMIIVFVYLTMQQV